MGVDVGGTKILTGILDSEGKIILSKKYPMRRDTGENALQAILFAIEDFMKVVNSECCPKPQAIGIGIVGHIDYEKGIWLHSYNIPIDEPVMLGEILSSRYNIPVKLDNDVHCATLGESRFGGGRGAACMLYINIGTGIAAGIIQGDVLIRGAANYAGEIGYMKLNCEMEDGKLEPVASGGGLIERANAMLPSYPNSLLKAYQATGELHSAAIYECAKKGDELAVLLAKRAILFLGNAICNLMAVVNPDVVVLGGGVVSNSYLCEKLRNFTKENCVGETYKALKRFEVSSLEADKTGLIGAASLVLF